MNKQRREQIKALSIKFEDLRNEIEELQTEEQDYYDNMPESLQSGDKGNTAQCAIDAFQSAWDACDQVIESLSEAAGD